MAVVTTFGSARMIQELRRSFGSLRPNPWHKQVKWESKYKAKTSIARSKARQLLSAAKFAYTPLAVQNYKFTYPRHTFDDLKSSLLPSESKTKYTDLYYCIAYIARSKGSLN